MEGKEWNKLSAALPAAACACVRVQAGKPEFCFCCCLVGGPGWENQPARKSRLSVHCSTRFMLPVLFLLARSMPPGSVSSGTACLECHCPSLGQFFSLSQGRCPEVKQGEGRSRENQARRAPSEEGWEGVLLPAFMVKAWFK